MMVFAWLLAGCPQSTRAECSEEVPCGFGEECIDGQCIAKSCSTSDQCAIEQYCDAENTCVAGCAADTDCMFGDICNLEARSCEADACVDTKLDCGFGQFCSQAGECYDAGGYYCKDCEDDGDCGGNGNFCYGGYCGVTCDTDADCPAGFDCLPFQDNNGNIVFHQCWTACWLFEDEE